MNSINYNYVVNSAGGLSGSLASWALMFIIGIIWSGPVVSLPRDVIKKLRYRIVDIYLPIFISANGNKADLIEVWPLCLIHADQIHSCALGKQYT